MTDEKHGMSEEEMREVCEFIHGAASTESVAKVTAYLIFGRPELDHARCGGRGLPRCQLRILFRGAGARR
jgi:hypothetical protein